jgi:hypothetical protein
MWPGIGWVLGYSGCKLMAQQLTDIGLGRLRAFSGSSILPWCGKGGNQACLRLQTPSLWYAGTALNRSSNFEIVVVATVLWNHFLQMYKAHGSPRCNACGFPSIVTRVFQMLSVWDTSRLFFSEQNFWRSLGSDRLVADFGAWHLVPKPFETWPWRQNRLVVCAAMRTLRRTTDSARRCPSTSGVLIPAAWDEPGWWMFQLWMC